MRTRSCFPLRSPGTRTSLQCTSRSSCAPRQIPSKVTTMSVEALLAGRPLPLSQPALRSIGRDCRTRTYRTLDKTVLTTPVQRLREPWALYNACHQSSVTRQKKKKKISFPHEMPRPRFQDKRLELEQPRSSSTTTVTVFQCIRPVQYEIRGNVGDMISIVHPASTSA